MTLSADELGPAKVLHVRDPAAGMKGIVVVDNVAAGPAIGGIRMAPDVSLEECARLARAMTLKNASAGLPHGGGKAVIFGDPAVEPARKESILRSFARAIEGLTDYIPGPDMGTDEVCLGWVWDEIGRAAGLPAEIGGIPLDEIGATARGLVAAVEVAKDFCGLELAGARVVVQGYGAVGRHAARMLADIGALVIGVSDSRGAIVAAGGLDLGRARPHEPSTLAPCRPAAGELGSRLNPTDSRSTTSATCRPRRRKRGFFRRGGTRPRTLASRVPRTSARPLRRKCARA